MARGINSTRWWRNENAHIDETEVWSKPAAESGKCERVLKADAKYAQKLLHVYDAAIGARGEGVAGWPIANREICVATRRLGVIGRER